MSIQDEAFGKSSAYLPPRKADEPIFVVIANTFGLSRQNPIVLPRGGSIGLDL